MRFSRRAVVGILVVIVCVACICYVRSFRYRNVEPEIAMSQLQQIVPDLRLVAHVQGIHAALRSSFSDEILFIGETKLLPDEFVRAVLPGAQKVVGGPWVPEMMFRARLPARLQWWQLPPESDVELYAQRNGETGPPRRVDVLLCARTGDMSTARVYIAYIGEAMGEPNTGDRWQGWFVAPRGFQPVKQRSRR